MRFRSQKPDVAIPDQPLAPYVLEGGTLRPDRPALIDGLTGRVVTHRQFASAVRGTAGGLAARGYVKGDVFATYSPNALEYPIAFHAVSLLGGVTTTVNPLFTVDELRRQLMDCRPRALFTAPALLDKAREAAAGTGVEEIYVFGGAEGALPFSALSSAEAPPPAPRLDPRLDLVALPYSSGTTGLPKGVMLTHRNLVANAEQSLAVLGLTGDDTLIAALPFFHIYGVLLMNITLRSGAAIVILPRFELESFLAALERHRVTYCNVVPPIMLALAKHPSVEGRDLRSLRVLFSGAAPLGEALATEAAARLGCQVQQGYGLTETSPVTHVNTGGIDGRLSPGSVGAPIPNTECRILDPASGHEVGPGEQGEIWVRGPQVMKGYLGRPDATKDMIDADGWLRTGDIGYADAGGNFYVVDRLKELIKYKGCPVAPAELEALLLTHPAVADVAVIPSPDEEAGEVPKAFVVTRAPVSPEELMAFVAARVAATKRVRRVEMIDQIPKSPSGKILRRVLVERERARAR